MAEGRRCHEAGVVPSPGRVGDGDANAITESCFAPLECALLARQAFSCQAAARRALCDDIEGCYNTQRRQAALGSLAPAAYERRNPLCVAWL